MAEGIDRALRGSSNKSQSVAEWLAIGSKDEDHPTCRASNHFHNPLKPFASSGLTDLVSFIRLSCGDPLSNVTWATRFTSPSQKGPSTTNTFDWDAARTAYRNGLTLPAPADRDAALAQTFQSLGHVMHLVQDLAVPAHARNDFASHLQYCGTSLSRWCENDFERFVRRNPQLVDSASPVAVDFTGHALTRFWDRDRYAGTSPTNDLLQGLAEYTNANFASRYTMLTASLDTGDPHWFPYPRESSTNLDQLVPQHILVQQVTAQDGVVDSGLYVKKITDGEPIEHFAKVGYLWSDLGGLPQAPPLRLTLQLDDIVNADYAALLLPRAVGYSTGLLDYFFRGRIELTFGDDPGDANNRNVSLINRSADVLGPGTLAFYTDDALGQRNAVPGGTLTISGPVGPDQPAAESVSLSSADISGDLIAVFQGSLGAEVSAVIGKVEDPVRVEELFLGGGDWMLRTAELIVPLGIGDGPGQVKWGDVDNTLVAQTFLPEGDMSFQVYRINRDAGSRAIPMRPNPLPAGGIAVDLTAVGPAATISGEQPLDLGVTVTLDLEVLYQQSLVTVAGQLDWDADLGVLTGASATVDVPVSQVFARQGQFPVAMPVPIPDDSRYDWSLLDFYANAAGDVVALVLVSLRSDSEAGPVVRHDRTTGALVEVSNGMAIAIRPPIPDLLYFVVNLTQRTVVARTCAETVALSYQTLQPLAVVDLIINGGPQNAPDGALRYVEFDLFDNPGTNEPVVGAIDTTSGVGGLSLDGFYRTDFDAAGFSNFSLSSSSTSSTLSIRRRDRNGLPLPGQTFGVALDGSRVETEPDPFPRMIYDMRRASGLEEAYALVGWNLGLHSEQWLPFRWSATAGDVAPLPAFASTTSTSDTVGFAIPSANHVATLFVEDRFDSRAFEFSQRTHLVTNQQSFLFADNVAASFLLLEPNRLYNVDDLRFHRINGILDRLSDPRALKAGGSSSGAYHLVGAR